MLSLAAAVLIAAAPAAHTNAGQSPVHGFSIGVALGPAFSFGDGPLFFKAAARIGYDFAPIATNLSLSVLLPVVFSGAHQDNSGGVIDTFGFEIIPGVRASYEAIPKLRVYGELGMGLSAYAFDVRLPIVGHRRGNATGFAARIALGVEYALIDHLDLFLEPMSLLLQGNPAVSYDIGNTHISSGSMPPQFGINLGATYRF